VNLVIYVRISIYFLIRYRNSKFRNRNSDSLTLQTSEFKKYFLTGIFGIEKESEFRLGWGSKKSEPKIGIPNQVLSAAKGMSSSVPKGTQHHTLPYPGTFYQFDTSIFHGQMTELDLDQAENLNQVENWPHALMKLPSTIDGCMLVMKGHSLKVTCHRGRSWTFICSHGIIMREIQDSCFGPISVGKLNVSVQNIKHTNSKGSAIQGKYEICFLI
jgi:hypothetical protein